MAKCSSCRCCSKVEPIGVQEQFKIKLNSPEQAIIALAGNPNVGKSTVFNALTGLNQHTGNWPGKTVSNAQGQVKFKDKDFLLVDLPGTYSLLANSVDEQVARDFICFGHPHVTIVVIDATCLERNLNLVFQVLEITPQVVVCLNLLDEAKKKGISVDAELLAQELGVPVIPTIAREGKGLEELMQAVYDLCLGIRQTFPKQITYDLDIETAVNKIEPQLIPLINGFVDARWAALRLLDGDQTILQQIDIPLVHKIAQETRMYRHNGFLRDRIVGNIYARAEKIAQKVVKNSSPKIDWDRRLDNILTSPIFGFPIMMLLLGVVFWLTIAGANVPSEIIANVLFQFQDYLSTLFLAWGAPAWLHGVLVLGLYRCLAWVISVMLPPMAIFFPCFTLLEDLGYLPRIAFNLDRFFKKAGTHGKQALTMSMGFGCNAAGVIACRIIESPREKLIAILTNNFVPCNGRFPTLIAVSSIFMGGAVAYNYSTMVASATIVLLVLLGISTTLLVSWLLSKTILQGEASSFTLELPPYRRPQIMQVIIRSIFDRTLFVLWRAIIVAAPAGAFIWLLANIMVGNQSIIAHIAQWLDPFGRLLGMDGFIILAFLLGLPANEIVLPILIMSYLATGSMLELDSLDALRKLFVEHGWNWLTALNVLLFSLLHFPCATTLLTMRKETNSWKWPLLAVLLTTAIAILVTFTTAQIARVCGLV